MGIPAKNPPPEVHRSTTVGVKEEETRWAGPPIEPPPPRFSSPPAVMPVTAAVAAAKAVAAEMLAAPVAETPGREWRVDAMDPSDPHATARDVHNAHVLPRWTLDENDGLAAGDGAFGAGATGASSSFASARDDAPVDAFPLPARRPSPPPAAVDPAARPAHRRGGGRRVGRHVRPPHGRVHRRPVGRVESWSRRRRVVRQVAKGAGCGGASHL